jgi:hypothetical protein
MVQEDNHGTINWFGGLDTEQAPINLQQLFHDL